MACSSDAEVESMIQTAIGALEIRVGSSMVQLEKDQVSMAAAKEALDVMSEQIKDEVAAQRQRINALIVNNNQTFAEHKSGIESVVTSFQNQTTELAAGIGVADAKFDALEAGLDSDADQQRIAMDSIKTEGEALATAIRQEGSNRAERFKVDTLGAFRAGAGADSVPTGLPRSTGARASCVNKMMRRYGNSQSSLRNRSSDIGSTPSTRTSTPCIDSDTQRSCSTA